MAASQGEKVTISCISSVSTGYLHWYQQKPKAFPKLLIYEVFNLASGVPARFSGSRSGNSYSLTIRSMHTEDAATYYCQQGTSYPFTQSAKSPQLLIYLVSKQFNRVPDTFSSYEKVTNFTLKMTSWEQVVLIQSPASITASQGEKVTISCIISVNTSNLYWYQQKPEVSPKLLIYSVSNMASGVPACFSCRATRHIVITQSPLSIPVTLEQSTFISFRSAKSSQLLIYLVSKQFNGVPDPFNSCGKGTDFTLKMSTSMSEDMDKFLLLSEICRESSHRARLHFLYLALLENDSLSSASLIKYAYIVMTTVT
ncbi:hypothetical protein U0070_000430 [Myodes glareolus]|uniref:Ig-like domain-containing protein n=1 Tax=Myodes glareolus TaxID=447135 RepID=A0AAW0H1F9_MYOGA